LQGKLLVAEFRHVQSVWFHHFFPLDVAGMRYQRFLIWFSVVRFNELAVDVLTQINRIDEDLPERI
jgi:hypothetical protein